MPAPLHLPAAQVMRDYPGVPGLFVAGVFSGALSTVSSGLNSLAAVSLRSAPALPAILTSLQGLHPVGV